ncbi:MAG: hypothetical protein EXS03_02050 [Phycisphaerales bacterium]|nr:hypothetical protein [Phycisphaerales bacterium]
MITTTALAAGFALSVAPSPESLTFAGPGGRTIELQLERFALVGVESLSATVEHGREMTRPMDPNRVRLYKASEVESSATGFVAFAPTGAIGWLDSDHGRLVLEGVGDPTRPGLRPGPWRWEHEGPGGAPPIEEVCAVLGHPGNDGGVAGSVGPSMPQLTRLVELAADLDYEFVSIFPSAGAASDYATALYGAVSCILERDCGVRLRLSYIRLFTTPDDLYNQENPLYPFRDEWETNQTAVQRDLAQLLTGRRNLPYGGVAWLNAACTNYGYSVSGYMIGSFAHSTQTNPGNWDLIVTTHELGHNVGTLHTHDYGVDSCASGSVQRGTIMSYCHVVSGATANVDLRMHRITGDAVKQYLWGPAAPCLAIDCNSNGLADADEIAAGALADTNSDGIADLCQDCDSDGILDPVELAEGAPDIDLDGVPDQCQRDCNLNLLPDGYEITVAMAQDLDGNSTIDSCDADCDGNGTADGVDLIVDVSRDLDRDGRIDSCEDCDGNGVPDPSDLAGALGLWTIQKAPALLVELDGRSGVRRRAIDLAALGIQQVSAIETTPTGMVLLAATGDAGPMLLEFDRASSTLRTVVAAGAGFPLAAKLRVAGLGAGAAPSVDALSTSADKITRWRLDTGALVMTTQNLPASAVPISFARSGDSFFILNADGTIRRSPGAGYPTLPFGALPVGADPTDLVALPDGRVLVTDRASDSIQAFSLGGALLGRFDFGPNPSSSVALTDPTALVLADQGAVVFALASGASAAVHGFRISDGYYLRTYRIYRVDAIGSDGFAQVGPSALDTDMNFELDSCEAGNPADINHDGIVDGLDLSALLSAWGSSDANADIDDNGVVSGSDLTQVLSAWGS